MEQQEQLIKKIKLVYKTIQKKVINPAFQFSEGGITNQQISKVLSELIKQFGGVSDERVVDFCICAAYNFRQQKEFHIRSVFSKASVKRLSQQTKSHRYYEDNWLSEKGINRKYLEDLIPHKKDHPLQKFVYMYSEEGTKRRMLNEKVGYILCQASTLGWSPLSESCSQCNFIEDCKQETQRKYPELYRIREEHGKTS